MTVGSRNSALCHMVALPFSMAGQMCQQLNQPHTCYISEVCMVSSWLSWRGVTLLSWNVNLEVDWTVEAPQMTSQIGMLHHWCCKMAVTGRYEHHNCIIVECVKLKKAQAFVTQEQLYELLDSDSLCWHMQLVIWQTWCLSLLWLLEGMLTLYLSHSLQIEMYLLLSGLHALLLLWNDIPSSYGHLAALVM